MTSLNFIVVENNDKSQKGEILRELLKDPNNEISTVEVERDNILLTTRETPILPKRLFLFVNDSYLSDGHLTDFLRIPQKDYTLYIIRQRVIFKIVTTFEMKTNFGMGKFEDGYIF